MDFVFSGKTKPARTALVAEMNCRPITPRVILCVKLERSGTSNPPGSEVLMRTEHQQINEAELSRMVCLSEA